MTGATKNGKNSGKADNRKTSKTKPRKEDPIITVTRINKRSDIILGMFTLVGIIITAMLAFPPLIAYFNSTPTPAFSLPPSFSATSTLLPSETPDVITPSPVPTTETPFPVSPLPETIGYEMIISLQANMSSGKAPLPVSFDASGSFLRSDNGSVWPCSQTRLCAYTWGVYKGGKQLGDPVQGQGKFNYTFSGKGTYTVTVYVCRGDVCDGSGIIIVAK